MILYVREKIGIIDQVMAKRHLSKIKVTLVQNQVKN